MKRFLSVVVLIFLGFSTGLLVSVIVNNTTIIDAVNNSGTYYYSFLIFLIFFLVFLSGLRFSPEKEVLEENELEDVSFMTSKRAGKLKGFKTFRFSKAGQYLDGFVLEAKKIGNDISITETDDMHMLAVGTTGTGKTTGLVDQTISILCRSRTKPSMVITDPKKELSEKHYRTLTDMGYKVEIIDLREPYKSTRWNPFSPVIRKIENLRELIKNERIENGRYVLGSDVFLRNSDLELKKQKYKDEIDENIRDVIYELCPIKNKDQPNWEEGARNLIVSMCYAFSEDCISGKIPLEKFTLFNLFHNLTMYAKEDTDVLKDYLIESRDRFSKVPPLAQTVLITQEKTLTSYLSEVNSYMMSLSDGGIQSLTSASELDFSEFDENPVALFIVVPDEKKTRHGYVTLLVTQMYKELVEKAGNMESGRLKRNVYFIMDEFGNLPKFSEIESMVTVSRSRGMRFLFILQSYSQLSDKYGKEKADTIKGNCNVKMFLGSDDYDTRKEFSELCGNRKIKTLSISTSLKNDPSCQTGVQTTPNITTSELERINGETKGEAIVSVRGFRPMFTCLTPSYELGDLYFTGECSLPEKEGRVFDPTTSSFDIGDGFIKDKKKDERELFESFEKSGSEETQVPDDIVTEMNISKRELDINGLIEDLILRVDKADRSLLTDIPVGDLPLILGTMKENYPKLYDKFDMLTELIKKENTT